MIELKHIRKSFGQLQVLKDISLSVDKAQVVSIVGPSGAGKTTLLQIMGSLDRPDSGKVLFDDTDVTSMNEKKLASRDARKDTLSFLIRLFLFHLLFMVVSIHQIQIQHDTKDCAPRLKYAQNRERNG